MTAGELAARAPAWAIGADPYEFLTRAAAFAYIRAWDVIAPAIDRALAGQAADHDRRVSELLEANNREVERRRGTERIADALRADCREAQDWYRRHEKAIRAAGGEGAPDFMVPF